MGGFQSTLCAAHLFQTLWTWHEIQGSAFRPPDFTIRDTLVIPSISTIACLVSAFGSGFPYGIPYHWGFLPTRFRLASILVYFYERPSLICLARPFGFSASSAINNLLFSCGPFA